MTSWQYYEIIHTNDFIRYTYETDILCDIIKSSDTVIKKLQNFYINHINAILKKTLHKCYT